MPAVLFGVPLLSNQLVLGVSSMVPHNREAQRTDLQYRWMRLRELPLDQY